MKITDEELLEELKNRFKENKKSLKELHDLNIQLKELNKKLEESEKTKSHFLSNIRNEIINPFASILGIAKNLQSLGSEQMDKVNKMASMIHSEAFSLNFQLQNIFAAAEIEAGETQPNFNKVEIISVFDSVIESYSYELQKKKLNVVFEKNNTIKYFRTDAEKLQLIFANLLDNCIKFSKPDSNIDITAVCENGILKITFTDYGIGIEEKDQLHIFNRFKRVNSDINTLNSGHGLGLSVTKAMLDILEGNIKFSSKKNNGSTFIISIPEALADNEMEGFASDGNEFLFTSDNEIF